MLQRPRRSMETLTDPKLELWATDLLAQLLAYYSGPLIAARGTP